MRNEKEEVRRAGKRRLKRGKGEGGVDARKTTWKLRQLNEMDEEGKFEERLTGGSRGVRAREAGDKTDGQVVKKLIREEKREFGKKCAKERGSEGQI